MENRTYGDDGVVGLGLKLKPTSESKMMMNQDRPFSSSTETNGRDDPTSIGGGSGSATTAFHISNTTSSFKSQGGEMGYPFTWAQWKELERQAMIYKYMMASVPIPTHLFLPISNIPNSAPLGRGSIYNIRLSNTTDPEPGRCRRTDGKKWRCSRDVAPDQKYCERHMHRGRPRSRKPVEVNAHGVINNNNNKKTRLLNHSLPSVSTFVDPSVNISSTQSLGSTSHQQTPVFVEKSDDKEGASYKDPRTLEWMMKEQTVPLASCDQQWQNLIIPNFNPSVFHQNYEEDGLSIKSYTHLSDDQTQPPRYFIDAWSNSITDDENKSSTVSSNDKSSISSLSLSMGGYNTTIGDESGQLQMGLGVIESDPSELKNWLSPVSWVGSTPGGPLAEVLRPSTVVPNPGSPPATTVSSPSGVLHRTVVSMSDSSGNSSPTLASSIAKAEIGFQWLNQRSLGSFSSS